MKLEDVAKEARKITVKISADGKAPHIGSCLSAIDILTSLYFDIFDKEMSPENFKRSDTPKILLSKGHAVAALYAILYLKGYMSKDRLLTYHKNGGLPAHADTTVDGIAFSTGSLGHGLAVGIGMALANRIDGNNAPIVVIMGDGECQEGAVWEAANFAVSKSVSNIIAIVDKNELQAYDQTANLGGRLEEKWAGFGWNVISADGHDLSSLNSAMTSALASAKPSVIIAKTVKCRGICAMEGKLESHYKPPKGDELGAFA